MLVHGFASNKEVNWVYPGWVSTLNPRRPPRHRARQSRPRQIDQALRPGRLSQPTSWPRMCGRCSIISALPACRRHGLFARRADHGISGVGASRAGAFGGARRAWHHLVEGTGLPETIAQRARGAEPRRRYRSDRLHVSGIRRADPFRPARARRLYPRLASAAEPRTRSAASRCPVLVAVGSNDQVAGSPEALAALIPGAQALVIPGRDHMLAVGDRVFKAGVLDFLARRP